MAKEITREPEKNTDCKIVNLTDIKANKGKELIEMVDEYDVVILRLRDGDLKLSKVTYS